MYEKQLDGFNSAGWILGHIYVEGQDVLNFYNIEYVHQHEWDQFFRFGTGSISSLNGLPIKEELLQQINERYSIIMELYLSLSEEQKNAPHPSQLLQNAYKNIDGWFAHHLTNHIAVHCGNITVWKKLIGLPVNGY